MCYSSLVQLSCLRSLHLWTGHRSHKFDGAAPADSGLFYLIKSQILAIRSLTLKPLKMTHRELDSSVTLSPLQFHSPSPQATRTHTGWNGMNPRLSLCRTEAEKKTNTEERTFYSTGITTKLTRVHPSLCWLVRKPPVLTLTCAQHQECVCMCVHLLSVLFRGPGILDYGNSNQRSDAGQQEKHHSCYATLVAHLSFRGHFLLAGEKKAKRKALFL